MLGEIFDKSVGGISIILGILFFISIILTDTTDFTQMEKTEGLFLFISSFLLIGVGRILWRE